jgi:nucleoside-triphosphatase THEP1
MNRRIVILTGKRGAGKTTVCRETVALARAGNRTCGGVLTLRRSNGSRDLQDARTGSTRRLTLGTGTDPAVVQGRFRFDPRVLAWGATTLARATPCRLLVVDELGPLEIERGEGLAEALDVLSRGDFELALVVVRPELVARVRSLMPGDTTTVLTVTRGNRNGLPTALAASLEGGTQP